MDSKPTAYFADSGAVWIAVLCPSGEYKTHQIGWRDMPAIFVKQMLMRRTNVNIAVNV